ncbi:MAG TPA: DUF885 family protein, partial [Chthoniobacterales bacterium]|nr:DUF885 family protein [Chthoniobacterales bacterium]
AFAEIRNADERLRGIYTGEWKWRVEQFPGLEGVTKPVPDHLSKEDVATQEMRLRHWEDVLHQLDAIPRSELSAEEQLNYDVFRPEIEDSIANQKFRDYEMPANSDSAFWSDFGYTARRPYKGVKDYENWIAQMRDVPRYFREEIANMKAGLARGFTPPRATLAGREKSIATVAEGKPEDNLLYTPFREAMVGVEAGDREKLKSEAVKVIGGIVQPAYADLLKFFRDEYVPHTRETLAGEALPDGKAYYRQKIREFTTLNLSADEVHKLGLSEVAKLHQQMVDVMHETGFKGEFPAFLQFLRDDPQFYAKTAQELLSRAAWIAKVFDGKSSQYFGYLPRMRFTIKPVPPDLAPFYTSGRGGAGVYLLNTYDLPHRPLFNLPALTLHESAPGHAFQGPIALEHKNQPDFRQHDYISAYGEGWALYCEKLGLEMGMYETPYERFGMLGYQIWRAARLVVDTGIHSKGWTRDQALQYMHEYTALPDHEIETEVDRYIGWPGQALSYYLGELAIVRAREKAEKALGTKFNIRAFHDAVLELGSVPLPVLTARIDRFIAEGGKGPYPEME